MASSTSPSEARWPRHALGLAVTAVLAWAACAAYSLWFNPENVFVKAAGRTKQEWARKMTREHGAKYLIAGTSSCLFSIDGERLEKQGVPAVNMGVFASLGGKTLAEWAISEARPGDSLVLAFEPTALCHTVLPTMTSVQFCYVMESPQWITGVLEPAGPSPLESLLALRPGGHHATLLAGKMALRRPLFRYAMSDIHPSGWVETQAKGELDGAAGEFEVIPPEGKLLLRSLAEWARTNQVRLCHALPVAYCAPVWSDSFQQSNARFLLMVSEFLPVLKDVRLGVNTNASLFADTAWHFNATGVAQRTDELAEPLRAWRMWNREELRFLATNGVARPVTR